jgi:hypothetical protein
MPAMMSRAPATRGDAAGGVRDEGVDFGIVSGRRREAAEDRHGKIDRPDVDPVGIPSTAVMASRFAKPSAVSIMKCEDIRQIIGTRVVVRAIDEGRVARHTAEVSMPRGGNLHARTSLARLGLRVDHRARIPSAPASSSI